MWLWMNWQWHCRLVHGYMVYTQLAQRQQQFHVAPTKECSQYTTSVDILKTTTKQQQQTTNQQATTRQSMCYKGLQSTHSESHIIWVQWACLRAENSTIQRWPIIITAYCKRKRFTNYTINQLQNCCEPILSTNSISTNWAHKAASLGVPITGK